MIRTVIAHNCLAFQKVGTVAEQIRGEDHPARRLGRKLKEARITAGYRSQQDFGTHLNMHRSGVAKIEIGARHISVGTLK
jgi:helix-turn-helix protein